LPLNMTAETSTESKFVAYSCEKPCGFFFKSCPFGFLQFEIVFHCAVPIHWIACLNKYSGLLYVSENSV
jgi:hypothetical protein